MKRDQLVHHKEFGRGLIQKVSPSASLIQVKFKHLGNQTVLSSTLTPIDMKKKYWVYAEKVMFDDISEEIEASSREEADAIGRMRLRDRKESERNWKPILEADEDGIVVF